MDHKYELSPFLTKLCDSFFNVFLKMSKNEVDKHDNQVGEIDESNVLNASTISKILIFLISNNMRQ